MFRAIILLLYEYFVLSMVHDMVQTPLSIKEKMRSFIFQRLDGLEYSSVKRTIFQGVITRSWAPWERRISVTVIPG